jgi:predicted nucleotidyltransferase
MIEEILPGNKTRLKIINTIYENPKINLTGLIKKVRASPNLVLKYVNNLLSYSVIKEEKRGGKKKVHIRIIEPNFDNELSQLIYSIVEIEKKIDFFKKYKKLKSYLTQLKEIFKSREGFVLVYGSYARFSAEEDSDLDLLIVGKLNKEETKRVEEIFITLESELSLKIETLQKFLKNKEKPLYKNILKEHIITDGTINFIKILAKIK